MMGLAGWPALACGGKRLARLRAVPPAIGVYFILTISTVASTPSTSD